MKLCRLMLVLVASPAVGQFNGSPQEGTSHVPASAERPNALVRELYREVVARHPIGIPGDADMKIFAPYLSRALLYRIDLARGCEDDYYRHHQNPNLKPPIEWLEFGLFTGGMEEAAPQKFRVLATEPEKNGSFRVYVELIIVYGLPTNPEPSVWYVAPIVVRENGQFVVDDVIFLKDYSTLENEFRLSKVLRTGCEDPSWVGYVGSRYPNEVPGFRFYINAIWDRLTPLVSSMKNVRQALGNPDEAKDVYGYTEPYPGDEKASEPVFTYKFSDDWELLVYFAKYCFHEVPQGTPADKLCSLDLVPRKRIVFDVSRLPNTFVKTHIEAVDAGWDEYSDGTGLRYEVYTTHTQYGSEKPGDLNRISYGPPKTSASEH